MATNKKSKNNSAKLHPHGYASPGGTIYLGLKQPPKAPRTAQSLQSRAIARRVKSGARKAGLNLKPYLKAVLSGTVNGNKELCAQYLISKKANT